MFNSVDFNYISKGANLKPNAFEEIAPRFDITKKITILPIAPEEAGFEPELEKDESEAVQGRFAPQDPSKPCLAIQLIYKPKDDADLQKKIEARKDFAAYIAEKMAEWDKAHPMNNPYDSGNGLRTMQWDSRYESHMKERAQYAYELEMEFWKSNPDYIPSHVMILGAEPPYSVELQ